MTDTKSHTETILFGAFDRHNFGDLLFPHVLAAMLPGRRLRFAGLAESDMREYGGHEVEAIATLIDLCGENPVDVVHVGGELLTCDAWQAAVMLSSTRRAKSVINERAAWLWVPLQWADEHLGIATRTPYVVSRGYFAHMRTLAFNAVGGVDLDRCEQSMRAEVFDSLKTANDITVRDTVTQATLEAAGISTRLLPDPAVMVAELFGGLIRGRSASEAISTIRDACPNGYIAVQFSADFGDDRTLDEIAAQLDEAAQSHGLGVAFFCAGIAPWHDDYEVFERTRQRMRTPAVQLLTSPNLWDICALIAGSSIYCGSSLHGRIVAAAFELPRVNIRHPASTAQRSKQSAFADTWEEPDMPGEVGIAELARSIDAALRIEPARLNRIAGALTSAYRAGFARLAAQLS
jgi:hypothetical protein